MANLDELHDEFALRSVGEAAFEVTKRILRAQMTEGDSDDWTNYVVGDLGLTSSMDLIPMRVVPEPVIPPKPEPPAGLNAGRWVFDSEGDSVAFAANCDTTVTYIAETGMFEFSDADEGSMCIIDLAAMVTRLKDDHAEYQDRIETWEAEHAPTEQDRIG